jgi:glutaredoxin-related protein
MNDLYVLLDLKSKNIMTPIQELPENWANINGLNLMEYEKIKDLNWSGNNFGWYDIKIEDFTGYHYDDIWVKTSKANLKSILSYKRWEMENEILEFEGNRIKLDERTKTSLTFKLLNSKEDDTITWKFLNGICELTYDKFLSLCNFVDTYSQKCFDIEFNLSNTIDSANNLKQLLSINFDLSWPKTIFDINLSDSSSA